MNPDAKALAIKAAEAAWDKKAFDLRLLNVTDLLQISDYFLICSGRSDRQVMAVCDSIDKALREMGRKPLSVEGRKWGRWICMDYGEVVIHIFYHEVRDLYDLDSLWAEAPRLELEEPAWVRGDAAPAYDE